MKGLILKDLLLLKNQMKNLIIVIIGLSILMMAQGSSSFIITIIPVYLLMLYISTFAYDDYNHFDTFACTLPYKRKDIIKAKFILLILSGIISSVLLVIITYLFRFFDNSLNQVELLSASFGSIGSVLLVASLFTPFIYKYGVQKGRMVVFGLVVAVPLIGGMILKNIQYDFTNIINYLNSLNVWLIIILALFIISIVLFISYLISCKIYNEKEF